MRLELSPQLSQRPQICKALIHQPQKNVTTDLASLISKMVCTEDLAHAEEESHEQ